MADDVRTAATVHAQNAVLLLSDERIGPSPSVGVMGADNADMLPLARAVAAVPQTVLSLLLGS